MADTTTTSMHPEPFSKGYRGNSRQAALLLAGGIVLLIGYLISIGSNSHWWNPVLELRFLTRSAAGLHPGMQVKLAGIPVGRVRRLQIRPDAMVLVSLDVGEDHRRLLGRNSRATLAQDNLLSESYVAISPDPQASGGRKLPEDALIAYDAQPNLETLLRSVAETRIPLQKALGATVGLARERIPASLEELDRTLQASRRLAGSLERDLGTTSRAVNGTAMQLRQTTAAADRLLNSSSGMTDEAGPLLLQTLQELRGIATTTNTLVQRLDRSLLLELLSPAPKSAPGAGPAPATQPQERNRRE